MKTGKRSADMSGGNGASRSRVRRPRRDIAGQPRRYRLTEAWRQRLGEAMESQGFSNRSLAEIVGCSHAAIGHLRTGVMTESGFVAPICAALNIPVPSVEIGSEGLAKAMAMLQQIEDKSGAEGVAGAVEFLELYAKRLR